ncbi:hypothetical protein NMG29_39195 [Streptomyces cocklensis]|nr:hypothetical protein [Actinacidiphila cocklensis]MDD1064109.1 hypothetical protein [Actinacidiphila cocklensis]
MNEIARRDAQTPAVEDLERFEEMLLDQLADAGLPTDGVLVDLVEREQALASFGGALRRLPMADRGRSVYVSKMITAAAAGLFDAALNYLWNETVRELRRRVTGYDLAYFFDIAVPSHDRRKHLSTEDDLVKVNDIDLLRAAREIGLLSATGHAQIDHIRYMRNYASAAHPNQVELTGMQLAAWLETCVRQVITLPYDTVTAETGRLLANIKTDQLDPGDVKSTTAFFEDLPRDRADALGAGLFGLYTNASRTPIVANNVLMLWPELWPEISEDARQRFGVQYGRFRASADTAQARAAKELLNLVDGGAYLPEHERAAEMDSVLDDLLAAHHGYSNFHTEPAPARALAALVGQYGNIPQAVENKYVLALVEVFLGNEYGVSWAAATSYDKLLDKLTSSQAGRALRSFTEPVISAQLWASKPQARWDTLLDVIEPKLTARADRELFQAVRTFTGTPDKLPSDSKIARLVEAPRVRRVVRRTKAK